MTRGSDAQLRAAKVEALARFRGMRGAIQDAFGALAKNRHGGAKVRYAWNRAEQRIRGAKFHGVLDSEAASDTWGETTDTEISITRGHAWLYDRYTDQLVDTLLHEALHFCAYLERPSGENGDGDDALGFAVGFGFEIIEDQIAPRRQRQLPRGGSGRCCDLLYVARSDAELRFWHSGQRCASGR